VTTSLGRDSQRRCHVKDASWYVPPPAPATAPQEDDAARPSPPAVLYGRWARRVDPDSGAITYVDLVYTQASLRILIAQIV